METVQTVKTTSSISSNTIEIDILEQQAEIWLACMLGDDSTKKSYNISESIFLEGPVNIEALKKAFSKLIVRHQSLRTTFNEDGSKMLIHPEMEFDVYLDDLTNMRKEDQTLSIQDLCTFCAEIIFQLETGPLFRISILKLSSNRYFFNFTAHHIICDGYSLGVILEDLGNLYSYSITPFKLDLPDSFLEFTEEEQEFYRSDYYQEIENYWLNQFKKEVSPLQLPTDFSHPKNRNFSGGRKIQTLTPELTSNLRKISTISGCSFVQVVRVLFEIFIYRITGQKDLVIGQLVSGQALAGYENLVGHCVNLLPIRSHILSDLSFIDFLKHRRKELLKLYDNQQYTLGSLLKKIPVQRKGGHTSLVSVLFNSTIGLDRNLNFAGIDIEHYDFYSGYEKFNLSFKVIGSEIAPRFEWNYNSQLFKSDTITRFLSDFEELITRVVISPNITISSIPNSSIELGKLVSTLPATTDQSILDLFKKQVATKPKSIALIFNNAKLTYKELDQLSSRLADYITSQKAKCSLIPLLVNPSMEMVISIIAILKSKSAYVPIDSSFPKERINAIIRDSRAEFIICDNETQHIVDDAISIKLFNVNRDMSLLNSSPIENKTQNVSCDDYAYIIYTSGSTGNPKGVIIDHGNIVDYVQGLMRALPIHECQNFVLGSTIATDLGNTTLFSSLVTGGALHIITKEDFNNILYIHRYFGENKIDFLKIVPSHWQALKNGDDGLFPSKILIFGGETLTNEVAASVCESNECECMVVNHYGPTETTIGKLLHIVDFKKRNYGQTIPIGKPFSNTRVYVINKNNELCPIGTPGELHISGIGVARGYLYDEKLTNEKFSKNPFTEESERIYRTGDLVRCLHDGQIEFLGRIDHQIKIRGNRVEVGEIQNVIQSHPSVRQCHIHVHNLDTNDSILIAFIVPELIFNEEAIYNYLKSRLPKFMLPKQIVSLEEIPLTPNGKVNTQALPLIQRTSTSTLDAPNNEIEEDLVDLWQNILNIKHIGVNENFFDLGGHSLMAVKIILAIEKKYGKRLPLASLFENSTIKELAITIKDNEDRIKWDCLVPIKTTGNKTPIYLVHGDGLNVLTFKPIAKYLDPEQPLYALQALGLNGDKSRLLYSMDDMADHYASEILQNNPTGPYILGGYSFGGLLAFEIARRLIELGKKVETLAILDTNCSNRNNNNSRFARIGRKIVRQFRKSIFIVDNFIHKPQQTLNYQRQFIKKKLYKKQSPTDLSNDFFSYDPEINRSYRVAKSIYKMTPLNINVLLFKTKERMYFIDDAKYYGWRRYALEGVKVHRVPGDHKTFLFEPNVKEFSSLLQLAIDSNRNEM